MAGTSLKYLLDSASTQTLSELYSSYPDGGESGFFAFVIAEQKFYEWKDDRWSEVIFDKSFNMSGETWLHTFENGNYTLTDADDSVNRPAGLQTPEQNATIEYKLVVYTDYVGKQVKVLQREDKAYFLVNGVITLIWTPVVPPKPQEHPHPHHHHTHHNHCTPQQPIEFKYLQDPVQTYQDLYIDFPNGGEFGWFCFVRESKTFAYWDVDLLKWGLLSNSTAQGSVLYSNPLPIPAIALGIDKGTTFLNKTMTEMWDALLYPESSPLLTIPSYYFTSNTGRSFEEIGAAINYIFTNVFYRGKINPLYIQNGTTLEWEATSNYPRTGAYAFTGDEDGIKTIISGANTWTRIVSFEAGVQPKTSKGLDFSTPYAAGTLTASLTVAGVYPVYARLTSAGLTKLPLQAHGTTINGIVLAEGAKDTAVIQVPKAWWNDTQWLTVQIQVFEPNQKIYVPITDPMFSNPTTVVVNGVDYIQWAYNDQYGSNTFKIFR